MRRGKMRITIQMNMKLTKTYSCIKAYVCNKYNFAQEIDKYYFIECYVGCNSRVDYVHCVLCKPPWVQTLTIVGLVLCVCYVNLYGCRP